MARAKAKKSGGKPAAKRPGKRGDKAKGADRGGRRRRSRDDLDSDSEELRAPDSDSDETDEVSSEETARPRRPARRKKKAPRTPSPAKPVKSKNHHDLMVDDVAHVLSRYHARMDDESVSVDLSPKLLNHTYSPDVVVRRGMRIAGIVEVEDKSNWKALLGSCLAADYVLGVEDASNERVPLWFVVPDDRSESHLKLFEMRLCWARDYCRRLRIKKVMRTSTFVAYWNQRLAADESKPADDYTDDDSR